MKSSKNKKPAEVVFADRTIMALSNEVAALVETTARVKALMNALAADRGIPVID